MAETSSGASYERGLIMILSVVAMAIWLAATVIIGGGILSLL